MNKEAQLANMLTIGFAVALSGWALVYLASPNSPTRCPAPHREPIPKIVRRHAASIAESPRMTQPWHSRASRCDTMKDKGTR